MDLPRVSLCLATSLDGRTATAMGKGPDFTSKADLARLFRLRAAADALLIGAGTVRAEEVLPLVRDSALADAREAAGKPRHPAAVIVSNSLNLPWSGRYFRYRKQRMFVLSANLDTSIRERMTALELETLETGTTLDLKAGLTQLYQLGFREILAEGGGGLVASLVRAGLVSRLFLTIAPLLIGGDTPQLLAGPRLPELAHFRLVALDQVGDEIHCEYAALTAPGP